MTISEVKGLYGEHGTSSCPKSEDNMQCLYLLTSETIGQKTIDNVLAGAVYFDKDGRATTIVRSWGYPNDMQDLWEKLHNAIGDRRTKDAQRASVSIYERNTPDLERSDLILAFDDGKEVVLDRQKYLRATPSLVTFSVDENFLSH